MKEKKILTLLTLTILILVFLFPTNQNLFTYSLDYDNFLPSQDADPIIIIDEDSDFAGYPGYGNESHPYIIQGKDIEVGTDEFGITVTNTTKYFEIRNNQIYRLGGSSNTYGIRIKNVGNNTAKIVNNQLSQLSNGFYAEDSQGIVIEGNTLLYVSGIFLFNCSNSRIKNNEIKKLTIQSPTIKSRIEAELHSYPEETGNYLKSEYETYYSVIRLYECSDSNVTGNYINPDRDEIVGIYAKHSDRVLIRDNIIEDINLDDLPDYEHLENAGIALYSLSYADIINNTLENNDKKSIHISNSDNIQICNNSLTESENLGVELLNVINANITYNIIQQHSSYGVNLGIGTANINIHHNHFIDNNIGYSQASDSGSNNVWYDIATNEGNWWNNWYGGPYSIDGAAGSVDPYPLGDPIVFPELLPKIGLVMLLSSILMLIPLIRKSKKK
jgi:parallel beta-helix repeat protein